MANEHTDCPACPRCTLPVGCPQMADHAGHHWDGRHQTDDPRALHCPACGHAWTERDIDRVAQAWRAQAAWYAREHDREVPT